MLFLQFKVVSLEHDMLKHVDGTQNVLLRPNGSP